MAHHLTSAERDRIAQLYHQQADRKEIARSLGRHPSTIGRELRRNGAGHEYYAVQRSVEPSVGADEHSGAEDSPSRDQPGRPQAVGGGVGATNRRPDEAAGLRPPRIAPNDLRLDQAGPGSSALGIAAAASGQTHLAENTAPTPDAADPQSSGSHRTAAATGRRGRRHGPGAARHGRLGDAGLPQVAADDRRQGSLQERRPRACESQATAARWTKPIAARSQPSTTARNSLLRPPGKAPRHGVILCRSGLSVSARHERERNGLIRQYFPKGTDFRDISHAEVRRVENRKAQQPPPPMSLFRTPAEFFFEKIRPLGCD